MTFPACHPALARALAARDYTQPTAVQTAVLDPAAKGRDLLVSAQTGSGKTVAFGLAMAETVLGDAERFETAGAPLALVIAPTRELAMQVEREFAWLYAETGARIATSVGGMDVRSEARRLQGGVHIVVGTPGRLRDHVERGRLDLSSLRAIVLDEADEMLDLGFREDLEFILDATAPARQTLLFSATMPREIEMLAKSYQRDALRIETLVRNAQHADIDYQAIRVAPHDVEHGVVNVLRFHETRAAIVFCSTREGVKRLNAKLSERGFSAVALSGELTQSERTQALQALRDGRARVLVATDVAARGLDLPDLALVIHADLPHDAETLLHRSGRTGRAGKKGLCVVIVPFNRRRKADILLQQAKLKVTWAPAPTPEEIRARDQERFLADSIFTDAASEEESELLSALKTQKSADEIALALVRMSRARLPAPEDLAEDTGPPPRRADWTRGAERRFDKGDGFERGPRPPRPARDDTRPMVWFRLSIGRERNADPRWLLPLICNAGKVSKSEVGAIKIFDRDTRFQIAAEVADKFAASALENKPKDATISRADGPPAAREPERSPQPGAESRRPPEAHAQDPRALHPRGQEKGDRPAERHMVDKPRKPFEKKPFDKAAHGKRSFDKPPYGKSHRRDETTQSADGGKRPWRKPGWENGKNAQNNDQRRDERRDGLREDRKPEAAGEAKRPPFKGGPKPFGKSGKSGGKPQSKYAHKKKNRPSTHPTR